MYVVFLAGGIAAGKSTVAREFKRHGALCIDLDCIAREVVASGAPIFARLVERFGTDIVNPVTGELDREGLARRAFANPTNRKDLESIELPAIKDRLVTLLNSYRFGSAPFAVCVVEIPLLDRVLDLAFLADEILVVTCPDDKRIERACKRGMDRADVCARLAAQPSEAFLLKYADTVIANDGTEAELIEHVRAWWGKYAQSVQKRARQT